MPGWEVVIGCVGKPSAGKSTFFNAVTEGNAKVGDYPFTTIEPNTGITYFRTKCPCKELGKADVCEPQYGMCVDGTRFVPVKMLDVAGLIPGASQGLGLGNKFLNDLCNADVLIHVVDISGTTNEKGEKTEGYDPANDVEWLESEIHEWILGNLWRRWGSIVRRHVALRANSSPPSAAETLQTQVSGYGATLPVVQRALDKLGLKEPVPLETWEEGDVRRFVVEFARERFPTVLLLNKADVGGAADRNIEKLCRKHDPELCVVGSALAECFLKRMRTLRFVRYGVGADDFSTFEDEEALAEALGEPQPEAAQLARAEPKMRKRLERIKDMVMYRFGGTGAWRAVQKAVELKSPVFAFPVRSLTNFGTAKGGKGVFGMCVPVRPGTTVRQLAAMINPDLERSFTYAEGLDGRRIAEDEVLTPENCIIKFTASARAAAAGAAGAASGDGK